MFNHELEQAMKHLDELFEEAINNENALNILKSIDVDANPKIK